MVAEACVAPGYFDVTETFSCTIKVEHLTNPIPRGVLDSSGNRNRREASSADIQHCQEKASAESEGSLSERIAE